MSEFNKRLEANVRESLRFAVGEVDEEAVRHMMAGINAVLDHPSAPAPQDHVGGMSITIQDSHFGPYVSIDMPAGCNMIVVFADKYQHVPVWIGLPHQLYVRTAKALMVEHDCQTLTVAPYRNENKVEISRAALATTEGQL